MERYNANTERLLRFDLVRLSKLLEIVQFGLVIFVIAFYVGSFIDNLFPDVTEKTPNSILIRDLALQMSLLLIAAYYIRKIGEIVPFLFSLTKDYKPSLKGEAAFGGAIAMTIIFAGVQRKFLDKITLLKNRFALNKQ
jgi:hypothetical protein